MAKRLLEHQLKNKKILFAIFAPLLIAGISYLAWSKFSSKPEPIYCAQEAKQCPDGSYVGLAGPKCEFAACPDENATTSPKISDSGIRGTVLLGPTCPVVMDPPDPQCADKPYKTFLVVTTVDGARVIKRFGSDESGKFNIELPPGEYAIRSAAAANILPYCASNGTVRVNANSYTETVVSCDTGIR